MKAPARPADEARRLEALHALCILDTAPEERFDRLTRLARLTLDVPVAVVSLVDSDRVWYKSAQGVQERENPRELAFCSHTILGDSVFVVPDILEDPRFRELPMAREGMRFYAGHPIRSPQGHKVGALCIVDTCPRELSAEQLQVLGDLAAMVETEIKFMEVGRLQEEVRERMAAQRRAEEDRNRFFDLSLDLLCIAGFDGYFKQLNPAWHRILGWSLRELQDLPYVTFVHPDDREPTARAASQLSEGAEIISFENRYRCKDGTYRWFLWTAAPAEDRELTYAVARDITELKQTEARLRASKETAEAANRAKSEFLANMSHELRTPLNSVIGFAGVMLHDKQSELSDQNLEYLRRIRDNGKHLLSLINSVLDLSKIEAGRMELETSEVDLGALVAETVEQLETGADEQRLRIAVDVPADLPPLRTDVGKLKQILINLLGNALKFTQEGEVRVTVEADPATRRATRISVRDTGIGIPPERLAAIFDSFQQGDSGISKRYAGTGLGLAISRSLADVLGFDLTVESEVGAGSTFSLVLTPARAGAAPEPAPEEPEPRDPEDPDSDSRRLDQRVALVIDDSTDSRILLSRQLTDLGFEVRTARDGIAGLRLAASIVPDLITLDLRMPGMSGWECLCRMKETPGVSGIPVIVVSVVGSESRGSIPGAFEVLDKPVTQERLEAAVERLLERA